MELKKKPANEINANIEALIREERDPQSFLKKIFDSIIYELKVISERFSPIK